MCVWVWFVGLPRHVMFYDIVEFIYSHKMSPALCRELPKLLAPPVNHMVHAEHIRILSEYRCQTSQCVCLWKFVCMYNVHASASLWLLFCVLFGLTTFHFYISLSAKFTGSSFH